MYKHRCISKQRLGNYLRWLLCAALLASGTLAQAASIDISAAFRPSAGSSEFKDTTPPSGFCLEYGGCAEHLHSVALPITYDRRVLTGLPVLARRWSLHTPPQATVTLLSARGEPLTVTFQITHVAQVLSGQGFDRRENPASHSSTGGNCTFTAPYGSEGSNGQGFIWKIADPVSPGLCYPATSGATAQREITVSARKLSVGYKLLLPQSHTVKSGLYYGSVTYSVGETADFSLGSQVSGLSDSSITFNFSVDVQHQLSVTFPPGSDAVELMPSPSYGGWHQYLSGLKPAPGGIYSILPFTISASGPFNVYVRCDEPDSFGRACLVRNVNNQVPASLLILLRLPPPFTTQGGSPVDQLFLEHERIRTILTRAPAVDVAGYFRIKIEDTAFEKIVLKNPGYPFRGGFTLVFDAQV